ncbi:MAG: tripartite tricarboxylate transporter substrate binding protein [Firmicutes bacterium]|nr:tripartite tricarboxylate transporter substrate binding protein [Bacillota bacterium]
MLALLVVGLTLLGSLGCTGNAKQEAYPKGPVELVVPQAAGSGPDLAGRAIADWVSKKWGKPITVVNRPGAGHIVGTQSVLQAKPDGYTMLVDGDAASAFQILAADKLPYKWDDRTFIASFARAPMIYVVNGSSPFKSLKDIEQRIKSDPATFKSSWQATNTVTGVTALQFFRAIGVDPKTVKLVEYQSTNEAITALAGGHIDFATVTLSVALPFVEMGKVRIVAITGDERLKRLPDVPTAAEQGYRINQYYWQGVSGPQGLPKQVADKWATAIKEMIADQNFVSQLEKQQLMFPSLLVGDEFKKMVLDEAQTIQRAMKGK